MSDQIVPPDVTIKLRQQAEQQLKTGTAPASNAFSASADALGVLYRLSSVTTTASDGLKLLHELQTYQVELDLQLEQLQQNERESSHELACYRQLFDMTPVGCLILSLDGIITDCNSAAERLFENGIQQTLESLRGSSLLSQLSPACRPMLKASLARVQRNQESATLIVTQNTNIVHSSASVSTRNLRLTIDMSADEKAIVIMLVDNITAPPPATESL